MREKLVFEAGNTSPNQTIMKALLVNGSSHLHGTTMKALEEMINIFHQEGVDTEVIYDAFKFKPGAAVAVARRGGTTAALDVINKYFGIAQMPIAGSTYWKKLEDIHSLNQKEIFNLLQKDFSGFKDITEKKVRAALAKTAGSPGIGLLTS